MMTQQLLGLTPQQGTTYALLTAAGVAHQTAMAVATGAGIAATNGGPGGNGSGSGGLSNRRPFAGDPEAQKISHLKNPTLDDLDQSGLWMVAGARGAVGDVRALKLQVRANQGKNGKIWGTTRGGYSRIDMPDDATPAQRAGMFATAGFAQEINNDPAAMDAARGAAVQAGAHRPQGFAQGIMANMSSYFGKNWATTGLGKQQFNNAMYSAAVSGAESYVGGRAGNAYSDYLRGRYGAWDQDKMDTLTLISSDPEASESAWNAGITQATDRLIASGTKISAANRGAALNQYCAGLRPAAAGSAIRAMVRYGAEDPRMKQFIADNPDENVNTAAGGMLLGEILRSMNPEEARAVHETYLQTNGADLSSNIVGAVSNLAVQNNVPAGVAYRSMASNVGGFASKITGNAGFARCGSFDEVRTMCADTYGTEAGGMMYDTIVSNAYDRAQLGLSSVGRNFANPEVAQAFDDTMEDAGGYIVDSSNPAAQRQPQDRRQCLQGRPRSPRLTSGDWTGRKCRLPRCLHRR